MIGTRRWKEGEEKIVHALSDERERRPFDNDSHSYCTHTCLADAEKTLSLKTNSWHRLRRQFKVQFLSFQCLIGAVISGISLSLSLSFWVHFSLWHPIGAITDSKHIAHKTKQITWRLWAKCVLSADSLLFTLSVFLLLLRSFAIFAVRPRMNL